MPRQVKSVRQCISRLLQKQKFGILSTQGKAQPYASIIGFETTRNLKHLFFATPKATRKYRLLKRCKKVALQVDNRPECKKNYKNIESLTATGNASEIKPGKKHRKVAERLGKRHPYLKEFYTSPSSALIQVSITRYIHVYRFQEVGKWTP